MKVSTSWYKFVCDAPQLWSTINISSLYDEFDRGQRIGSGINRTIHFLECSLSRSKSALLDISLDWDYYKNEFEEYEGSPETDGTRIVLSLMGDNRVHCKRWRSLLWNDYWPGITLWNAVAIIPLTLPSLQTLTLVAVVWGRPGRELPDKNPLCLPIPRCPVLQRLEFVRFDERHPSTSFLGRREYGSPPWLVYEPRFRWSLQDLRRLNTFSDLQALIIRTGEAVEILCGFTELLDSCHKEIEGISDPAHLPKIHFPRLHTLRIECRRRPHLATIVFALFQAPLLKHLEFGSAWQWGHLVRYPGDLLNFAHHAHHLLDGIEVLKLDFQNEMSALLEYEVIHFLHVTRSLRELHLSKKLQNGLGKRVHDEANRLGWSFVVYP